MSIPVNQNEITAYNYFVGKGLTPTASAGIVGNLQQESGVNPESVQVGGPGRGIAQWAQGGRWNPALMTGNPSVDLNNQLGYVWNELNTGYSGTLSSIQSAPNVTAATVDFQNTYEIPNPAYADTSARVAYAQSVLNAAGGSPTVTGSTANSTGTISTVPAMLMNNNSGGSGGSGSGGSGGSTSNMGTVLGIVGNDIVGTGGGLMIGVLLILAGLGMLAFQAYSKAKGSIMPMGGSIT